jgi:molybdate transport system substrate-binding protein
MTTVNCISSMATRRILAELAQAYEVASGVPVVLTATGGVDAAQRIAQGEAFDVAVLASDALSGLVASGHVVEGSTRPVANSETALAVAAGAALPPIDTREQLVEVLLGARSIGYSTGPSGRALLSLLAQWKVLAELEARLVQARVGSPVGEFIAQGAVELGFQQHSELLHCRGIAIVGSLPAGAEITTVFTAGVCTSARDAAGAERFIAFLRSEQAESVLRREGMAPP